MNFDFPGHEDVFLSGASFLHRWMKHVTFSHTVLADFLRQALTLPSREAASQPSSELWPCDLASRVCAAPLPRAI